MSQIAEYARSGRVVVFDTETTGCSRWDEICQIAAVEYVDGVRTRTFSVYVCPTCEMNPWAEGVHGLSLDFLSEHGLAPEEAMRQFFGFLGSDALLVAHNSRFDLRMLSQECRKFDISFAPDGIETCDTVALARHLRPGLGSYSLANLIEALDIDGTNSHDALDDALACAGLFFKLLREVRGDRSTRGQTLRKQKCEGTDPSDNSIICPKQPMKGRFHDNRKST